jgi:outer membrane murein-binding lipoprotein Lpp
MFKLCSFLLLSSILVLSGCSSQVKRNETANTTRPVVKALQNFSIDMSPEAEQSLPGLAGST